MHVTILLEVLVRIASLHVEKLLTKNEVAHWWKKEMTFDLSDIVKWVETFGSAQMLKNFSQENGAGNYGILNVEETSSSLGRCHLFSFSTKFLVK